MPSIRHINPVLRATGVIAIVAILTTGVTFAVLNNQVAATDNTITADTAALRVNTDGDATFSVQEPGFAFTGIVPGTVTPPANAKTLQVRNLSEAALDVNVHIVASAALPTGVTGDDITFTFTPIGGGATVTATWAQLVAGDGVPALEDLMGTKSIDIKVDIGGTVAAATVDVPAFDLVFGTVAP